MSPRPRGGVAVHPAHAPQRLRTAISGALIGQTGVLHRRVGDEPTPRVAVRIRPDELLARLDRQEREIRLEADALAPFPACS